MHIHYIKPKSNRKTFHIVRPLLWIGVAAGLVASAATLVTRIFDMDLFGFSYSPTARTWLAFVVFAYLAAVLISSLGRSSSAVPILIIPFVTQYYQTGLGWDVATDASSFLRLLPLIVMALAMWIWIFRHRSGVSWLEALFLTCWAIASLGWAIGSYYLGLEIGLGALFFVCCLLPGLYYFVKSRLLYSKRFPDEVTIALYFGFWLFVAGTLLTSLIGMDYRGSSNLLLIRNVNDTNSVVGYMLLTWPFALRADQSLLRGRSLPLMVVGFLLVVALSFSRGVFLVSMPLLLLTLALYIRSLKQTVLLVALFAVIAVIVWPLYGEAILYAWSQRINTSNDGLLIFRTLYSSISDQFAGTGRYEIWSSALMMFARSPLIGNGFGALRSLGPGVAGFSGAHSLLFQILAEQGIVGFLLIYGLLAGVIVRMLRLLKRTVGAGRRCTLAMLCSFISWFIIAHTVGADAMTLFGAQVNVIAPMLFILLLFPKTYASIKVVGGQ